MKFKRILSILLASLMLTGVMTVGANAAWVAPEAKTPDSYAIPWIGKYLAWPGEMLITKLILPKLLGGVLDGLLDGLPVDGLASDDFLNGILSSAGAGLAQAATASMIPSIGSIYTLIAPDAPAALKSATTAFPSTPIVWGVTNAEDFGKKLAIALRPALVFGFVAETHPTMPQAGADVAKKIKDAYATAIVPALRALGVAPADQSVIDAAYTAVQTSAGLFGGGQPTPTATAAAIDVLITKTIGALFQGVESLVAGLKNNPTDFIFAKLPNLLYNGPGLAGLNGLFTALSVPAASIPDLSMLEDIDTTLADLLNGLLPGVDMKAADLIKKIKFAGDLDANKIVVADKTLVYNILINYICNLLNKDLVPALQGLVGDKVPAFLLTIAVYLVKALVWMFRI